MNDAKFWWWIRERHRIYTARKNGEPWPWTKDKILQEYKFTNVFRRLDKQTIELIKAMRYAEACGAQGPELLFRICMFRLFNWASTYKVLIGMSKDYTGLSDLGKNYSVDKAVKRLRNMQEDGQKVFTGAYIVTNAGGTRPKIELYAEGLQAIWKQRESIFYSVTGQNTIEHATQTMRAYPLVGPFVSYELATDFTYFKKILDEPEDAMTYANAGPGAMRGLNRIYGIQPLRKKWNQFQACQAMQQLLVKSTDTPALLGTGVPPLQLREIEHSLCEYDKYMRVKLGEGKPRSRYNPPV